MKFIFDEVLKQLNQSVDDHTHSMSFGGAKSFEQYTELCGRIAGLRLSLGVVQDVQEMLNRQEDEV